MILISHLQKTKTFDLKFCFFSKINAVENTYQCNQLSSCFNIMSWFHLTFGVICFLLPRSYPFVMSFACSVIFTKRNTFFSCNLKSRLLLGMLAHSTRALHERFNLNRFFIKHRTNMKIITNPRQFFNINQSCTCSRSSDRGNRTLHLSIQRRMCHY